MQKETIDLKLLHYFVTIAESLSFTTASESLNIAKSALSKGINKLEGELGTKVFERSSRVVRLTEAGQILYHRALVLLEDADHLVSDIKTLQNSVSGHLKVAAPPTLGRMLASEIIPPFLKQWPDVSISLKLSYDYEDLFKEGLDLAFRMGVNRDQNLIERPLGQANRVVVAAPDYLAQHAPIRTPHDLLTHKSLQFSNHIPQEWTLQNRAHVEHVSLSVALQCSDLAALRNAARAGLGVAQLPWMLVRDDINNGQLTHVLPQWLSTGLPIALVYKEGHRKAAKLAEFLSFVEAHKQLFELRFSE
ncbi:LysR family transcriptional regulator [Saccharophagus degradans]|uniref:LysR family transcriptional regulator n=1 Tax=Saccharophagus degradans TaxID=86304 RepID=UPI001C08D412|nr:LysR family transcriptional regulator [Saccharophagus degradans]MBU2986553.1 LysR family transcriptional regulator [Saccharophagus degradans]